MWPIRSFLFVPAHRPDWVKKAIRSETAAVILDVEDAVPPDEKPKARAALAGEIAELAAAGTRAFVRINSLSEGGAADVGPAVAAGLTGIVLPKAAHPGEVRELHDRISYWEGRAGMPHGEVAILPTPETAEGLFDAHGLAKASSRVKGILGVCGGTVGGDVARAFGFRPTMEGHEQLYMLSKMVLDSRAAGAIYPVTAIMGTPLDDLAAVERLIRRCKEIGYTGMVVLHPTHIPFVNAIMRPTDDEIAYCEGMLAAFAEAEAGGTGAVRYKGAMVDYAMLPYARGIVAEVQAVRAREAAKAAT